MPAVAVMVCQRCAGVSHNVLGDRHGATTMPPCACGGRLQVSRIFYDRRLRNEPVEVDRRVPHAGS